MNPIPIIVAGVVALAGVIVSPIIIARLRKKLRNKSVLFLGPQQSGKTTLLNWLLKGDDTKEHIQTGSLETSRNDNAPIEYQDEKYNIRYSDMGGSIENLSRGRLEKYYHEHDVIIFIFNIALYLDNEDYKDDVNARLEALYQLELRSKDKKSTLLIGSHRDAIPTCANSNPDKIRGEIWNRMIPKLAGKEYSCLFEDNDLVLANLKEKKEIDGIFHQLIKKMKK